MFESLPTLHNCYMSVNSPLGSSNTGAKLQLLDEHNATANNVARVLEDCLVNYCHTLPICREDTETYINRPSLWSDNDSPRYTGKGKALISSICRNIPWRINSDVGGIGVSALPAIWHYLLRSFESSGPLISVVHPRLLVLGGQPLSLTTSIVTRTLLSYSG